ncbi:membrane protein insertion efficiency factor YidD [Gordonia sp. DT30]|uniref:membrane protein insertion efficiency factor YidD n=1 Tax=unclassified Gordonia (in: high G+C Gram-positive bacteria) TaxID=2657482 RepID=UPI003CEEC3D8
MIFLIELYRTWVSPLRLPTCRFEPTCSAYAVEALTTRGFVHGGALSILRLLKCGPWHKPGYDPVPERGFRHRAPVTDPVGPNAAGPNTAAETSYRIADCGVRASMEVRDS